MVNINSSLFIIFFIFDLGFISIDCGSPDGTNYTDQDTGIFYTSDYGYIQTGVSKNISLHHNSTYVSRQYWSIRSFPNGSRNCYTLKSLEKGNKYIIRASFLYDDDDNDDHVEIRAPPPQFDLYLGATLWTAVAAVNATRRPWWSEIVTVAMADFLSCVWWGRKGLGSPSSLLWSSGLWMMKCILWWEGDRLLFSSSVSTLGQHFSLGKTTFFLVL